MATFQHTSLNRNGQVVSGTIVAPDQLSASIEITKQGLLPQKIRKSYSFYRTDFRDEDLLHFNQELLALLKAGIKVHDAIKLLVLNNEKTNIVGYFANIEKEIETGSSFSDACAKHGDKFDNLYIQAIRIGEKSGDLYKSLCNYQHYLQRKININKKLKKALIYPGFLLSILIIILAVLFTFVIPRFVTLYSDFSADLPALTQFLIATVENGHILVSTFVLVIVGGYLALKKLGNTPQGRLLLARWKQRIPIYGKLDKVRNAMRISRMMASLMSSGMKIPDAIEVIRASISNEMLNRKLISAHEMVQSGNSVASSFAKNNLLPAKSVHMIEIGEKSGSLTEMLENIADIYEQETEHEVDIIISLVEPTFMLIVGFLIGVILIAIYLPILSIVEHI